MPYDMWSRYRVNERIKEGYEKRMERLKIVLFFKLIVLSLYLLP